MSRRAAIPLDFIIIIIIIVIIIVMILFCLAPIECKGGMSE